MICIVENDRRESKVSGPYQVKNEDLKRILECLEGYILKEK